ncbi:MAG TPA: ATP-binding protein [Pseudonocardiaceae bacterium]|jgi:two-component sensor histidine kinase|nr:ATP-binding protein [Pseudonocardiaceae bacterium]
MSRSIDAIWPIRALRCHRRGVTTTWCELTETSAIHDRAIDLLSDVDSDRRVDAMLVLGELVDNARTHGRPPGAARVWRVAAGRRLRVEVRDASSAPPKPQVPTLTDLHGRGLLLVEALTSAWGVWQHQRGKTVWAEIPV